jgi:hypothetical protein
MILVIPSEPKASRGIAIVPIERSFYGTGHDSSTVPLLRLRSE